MLRRRARKRDATLADIAGRLAAMERALTAAFEHAGLGVPDLGPRLQLCEDRLDDYDTALEIIGQGLLARDRPPDRCYSGRTASVWARWRVLVRARPG
jgi:hypothetical protein